MSISLPGSISPRELQKLQPPSSVLPTDLPPPPPPPQLHFGAPLGILTTPASSHVDRPPWLKHTPSQDGLIPMDIDVQSPTRMKAGHVAQVQRAHTTSQSPPRTRPHTPASLSLSALSSAHASPSGRLWTSAGEAGRLVSAPASPSITDANGRPGTSPAGGMNAETSTFGQPGAVLRAPSFGAPGPALTAPLTLGPSSTLTALTASTLAFGASTSALTLALGAPAHTFSPSPLSSLPPSPSNLSPVSRARGAAPGGWWVGGQYFQSSIEAKKHKAMITTGEQSIAHSVKANSRPEERTKQRTEDDNRTEQHTEEGVARAAVVYQSKAKARSKEAEETSYKRESSGLSGSANTARSASNLSGRRSNTSGSKCSSTGRASEGVRFSCFCYGRNRTLMSLTSSPVLHVLSTQMITID
ncbi:hypothetical protein C8R44DRAFT_140501 [Mycena epipterygia]|nr:hypothetical protein C8R44DRAFT_140501 [Mycena epipterygia]